MHNPGAPRRGNVELFPAVIAREGGRSSIPETLMKKSRGRGVLDRPVKPDDDSSLSAVAQRATASAEAHRAKAKGGSDEAIQNRGSRAMDCFASARNDGFSVLAV
jgi:hypothetical protein